MLGLAALDAPPDSPVAARLAERGTGSSVAVEELRNCASGIHRRR
ncbi:hypothetical protein SALBM217S_05203 [Streptomyces griseoloalbus]